MTEIRSYHQKGNNRYYRFDRPNSHSSEITDFKPNLYIISNLKAGESNGTPVPPTQTPPTHTENDDQKVLKRKLSDDNENGDSSEVVDVKKSKMDSSEESNNNQKEDDKKSQTKSGK